MKRFFLFCALLSVGFATIGCEDAKKQAGQKGKDATSAAKGAASNVASAAEETASDMANATGVSDMMGKATEALSSIEGGSGMLKNVTDSFSSLTGALKGITDADSATAALPKLSDLTEKFGGMSEMFGKLPATAKTAVSGVFSSALGELKPILDKVMSLPGVESILKPAIETLMAKIKSFQD